MVAYKKIDASDLISKRHINVIYSLIFGTNVRHPYGCCHTMNPTKKQWCRSKPIIILKMHISIFVVATMVGKESKNQRDPKKRENLLAVSTYVNCVLPYSHKRERDGDKHRMRMGSICSCVTFFLFYVVIF